MRDFTPGAARSKACATSSSELAPQPSTFPAMSNAEARPDRQRRTPVRPMLNEQRDHHVHLCHALAHYIARELPLQVVRQFEIAEHGDERMHLTFIVPRRRSGR